MRHLGARGQVKVKVKEEKPFTNYYSEVAPRHIQSFSKYGFSSSFGGKNDVVPSMRLQVIQESLFSRVGSRPIFRAG